MLKTRVANAILKVGVDPHKERSLSRLHEKWGTQLERQRDKARKFAPKGIERRQQFSKNAPGLRGIYTSDRNSNTAKLPHLGNEKRRSPHYYDIMQFNAERGWDIR